MIVTPIPFDLDLAASAPGYIRGAGLHMSAIYGKMYEEREPDRYGKKKRPEPKLATDARMGVGMALEEALEESLVRRLTGEGRPGEFVEPEYGIIYSPDLLFFLEDMPHGDVRVAECKLTWMSSTGFPREVENGFPPKANKYVTQLALYCRCLRTRYGRLYAVFVNGTWKHTDPHWGFKPQPLAWDLTFTQHELDEEWQAAINVAKREGMIR